MLVRDRIHTCTPAAQARGVSSGMSAGAARSLAPGIQLAPDDPSARERHLRALALGMLQYTPNVTFFREHAVLMEVRASLILFGGPVQLCHRVRATLARLGMRAQLGMAPTALGAWLLSRQHPAGRRALSMTRLARLLDTLPAHALPAAQPYADWLEGIGCRTLGQLRGLPRAALQQRSAPALMRDADAAYGLSVQCFDWFEPPPCFSQRYDLVEHIEHTGGVLAVALRLIEQLCGWLQARQLAVGQLDFTLDHEKGRHARPPTRFALRLSENAWAPDDFAAVLREQVQTLSLPAPVVGIALSAHHPAERPPANTSLLPEPAQWQRQEHRLLDLLRARLGPARLRRSVPVADYRPEQANLWLPLGTEPDGGLEGAAIAPPPQLPTHARPCWLLDPPEPLNTRNNRPMHQGAPLRLILGPERMESGWWSSTGHAQRDYFVAQDSQGARYWVYRLRGKPPQGWFLHGLFG